MCTGWRYRLAAVLAAVVGEEHERAPLLLDLAQEVTLRREGQQVSPKGGNTKRWGEVGRVGESEGEAGQSGGSGGEHAGEIICVVCVQDRGGGRCKRQRRTCDPVTKPTASEGTMMVVRSSPSSSSMWTGPTRWAITHSAYLGVQQGA